MRIEPTRLSQTGEIRRVGDGDSRNRYVSTSSPVEDTTDLLAISSGLRVARQRDILVDQLREAYRSGALRPDPGRIADRLMRWGFDISGRELP